MRARPGGVALAFLLLAVLAARVSAEELRAVAEFAAIADRTDRSIALFQEAGKVNLHPRCTNCHATGERPLQGEAGRAHRPLVVRGAKDLGVPGLACRACHGAANFDAARAPGDPRWAMAPAPAGWSGKSLGFVCAQLKDPRRNGGKTVAQIVEHLVTDSLVRWAWRPGAGRRPAPGSHDEFVTLMRAWAATGAHCPAP